jgi:hypothetical protein
MAINPIGVVRGGLVAGFVINIGEFLLNMPVAGEQLNQEMTARNLPPMESSTIALFVAMCFGLGLFLVWLYAAIRPRFGPGAQTAICAGLIVWGLAYLWPNIGMAAMGMFSLGLTVLVVAWGLGEVLVAAVVGAYLYQEGPIS